MTDKGVGVRTSPSWARAFTLLELIIVLLVLGVLAAIAIPTFNRIQENSISGSLVSEADAVARNANAIAFSSGEGRVTDFVLQSAVDESYDPATSPTVDAGQVELVKLSGNIECRVIVASINGDALVGDPACGAAGSVITALAPADPGTGSVPTGGGGGGGAGGGTVVVAAPGAPVIRSVQARDGLVSLGWNMPASDGGAPVIQPNFYVSTTSASGPWTGPLASSDPVFAAPAGDMWTAVNNAALDYTHSSKLVLPNGVTHYIKFALENSAGEGASTSATVTPVGAPTAATNMSLSSVVVGELSVTWTSLSTSANPTTTSTIEVCEDSAMSVNCAESDMVDPGTGVVNRSVGGLASGTSYWVRIRSVNDAYSGNPADPNAGSATYSVIGELRSAYNAQATYQYTCPAGYSYTGTQCLYYYSYGASYRYIGPSQGYYYCPNGGSLSSYTCTIRQYAAATTTTTYSCPITGSTLIGQSVCRFPDYVEPVT